MPAPPTPPPPAWVRKILRESNDALRRSREVLEETQTIAREDALEAARTLSRRAMGASSRRDDE